MGTIDDRHLERLLRGRIPPGEEEPELASFLADFDETYPEPSVTHCEEAHLAAMFLIAQQLAADVDPMLTRAARRGDIVSGPGEGVRPRPWTARRLPRWAGVKLAIPLAAILLAFGGVALAGGVVYHQASSDGAPSTTTQPTVSPAATADSLPDSSGHSDGANDVTVDQGEQGDANEPEDAVASEGGNDRQDDSEESAFGADERGDQNDEQGDACKPNVRQEEGQEEGQDDDHAGEFAVEHTDDGSHDETNGTTVREDDRHSEPPSATADDEDGADD